MTEVRFAFRARHSEVRSVLLLPLENLSSESSLRVIFANVYRMHTSEGIGSLQRRTGYVVWASLCHRTDTYSCI